MRTLEQALREHTGCNDGWLHDMPNVLRAALPADAPLSERAALGSSVFHEYARVILALPGHERHPMHITDEEYASFVAAVPPQPASGDGVPEAQAPSPATTSIATYTSETIVAPATWQLSGDFGRSDA